MIKKEIAQSLYDQHGGMTIAEAETHTQTLLDLISEALQNGESVNIANFGKFHLKKKKVREVTLPNGKTMLSNAGDRIQFLPSPKLKAYINAEE